MARAPAVSAAPDEPSLALPRDFWKRFAREHWDKGPVLFPGLFPAHFPTPHEIFEALVDVGDRYRQGEVMLPLRFYVEGTASDGEAPEVFNLFSVARYLPTKEDGTLDAYVERLDKQLGGRRFGIVLANTQSHHWSHWLQMRSFLAGFHEALGVPLGGADSALFLGNYQHTPFGVHKDDLHVFYFVIQGRRRMAYWPLEMLASRPEVARNAGPDLKDRPCGVLLRDAEDSRQVMAQATFLEGGAGDFLYWPSSYWHRSEPTPGLTIAASLGVNFRAPMFLDMAPAHEWPGKLKHSELPRSGKWKVPPAVRTALRARGQRNSLKAAERELTEGWVRFLTNGALDGPPPEARELPPLTEGDWVRASPERPIITAALSDGHVVVAANGRSTSLRVPAGVRARIERLAAELNAGKPRQVGELEERFFHRLAPRAFKRSAFTELLGDLARWRAVQRCAPGKKR